MDKMEKWIRQAINDDVGGVYLMIGTSINDLKNKAIDRINEIEIFHADHSGIRIGATIIYFVSVFDERITDKIRILNARDVYFDESVSMEDMPTEMFLSTPILFKGITTLLERDI